jgi:hypothetical protein
MNKVQFNLKIAEVAAKAFSLEPSAGQDGTDTCLDIMRYNISVLKSEMRQSV